MSIAIDPHKYQYPLLQNREFGDVGDTHGSGGIESIHRYNYLPLYT